MHYNLKNSKKKRASVDIISTLKDTVSIEEVVSLLGVSGQYGWTRSGHSLQGQCPTGHPSQSGTSFSINLTGNYFYCFNCNKGGDIISLVEIVNRIDTKAAVRWLAEKFNQSLLTHLPNSEDTNYARETAHFQHQDLFNLIFEHGKEMLHDSPDALSVRDYLTKERGYDLALLKNTEFIYWDEEANIRKYLKDNAPEQEEQIKSLSLNGGFGDRFRLAIPFRDMHGLITGFLKRAHIPQGFNIGGRTGVRWDSTKGLTKQDPFGMHRIPRGQKTLLLLEGYPDATYLPAVGIENVIALGQAAFSEQYLSALELRGVKRLILALDNDGGTGIRNTEDICQRFIGEDIQVFVIDPPLLGAHKDPDEFVKANGVEAMKQLVEKAELGSTWRMKRILDRAKISTDLEREQTISEAFDFCDSLSSMREAEIGLQLLASTMNFSNEILLQEYARWKERKAAQRLKDGFLEAAQSTEGLMKAGNVDEAIRTMQASFASLQSEYWREKEPETENFDEFLKSKKSRDSVRNANDRLGYQLTDFAEIDKVLRGLQTGLYIIAADPNIGKTAFMVSLMIDVLKSNDDVTCLFYSMDDSRDMIINRCLAHLTDLKINEVRHKLDDQANQTHLDNAYQVLTRWNGEKRLDILEGTAGLTMTRIESQIREHPNRRKIVVFIDGLYNVPLENDYGSIREENIERASQVKRLVREFNLPMIVTAEFRKQGREESYTSKKDRTIHDIMETGKYGYNADLIMLLSPKDSEMYGQQDNPTIVANFGKNKLESFRGTMEFEFIRAKSVMKFKTNSKTEY